MISELCIFNNSKICDSCGDCEICELDTSKLCDNCGKCLNLSDSEIRSININALFNKEDKIEEGIEEISTIEDMEDCSLEDYQSDYSYSNKEGEGDYENLEEWILIDDLEEGEEYMNNSSESYPGLIRIDTRRK